MHYLQKQFLLYSSINIYVKDSGNKLVNEHQKNTIKNDKRIKEHRYNENLKW